jgi:hypothetical protein
MDDPREDKPDWPWPSWLAEGGVPEDEFLALQEAAEEAARERDLQPQVVPAIPRRRYIYRSTQLTRIGPRAFHCKVVIVSAQGEFTGESEGPEFPGARAEIAARATIEALNKAEKGSVTLGLKGARLLRVFESPMVVVGVYGMNTGATPLVGLCLVDNSVEQAATLATLQAADRWLAWEAKKRTK